MNRLLTKIRDYILRLFRRSNGSSMGANSPRNARMTEWPDDDLPGQRDGWDMAKRRGRNG